MTGVGRWFDRLRNRVGSTTRTVVLLLVLVSAGFVITGYLAVSWTRDLLTDEVDQRLIDDAGATAIGLRSNADHEMDIEKIGDALGGRQAMAMISPAGDVVAESPSLTSSGSRPDPGPALPPAAQLADAIGQPFDVPAVSGDLRYRILTSDLPDGSILVLATPLAATDQIIARLTSALALSGALILIILGVFIWAVIRSANRQIDQMIDTAAAVGSGDLTARIDDTVGATEAARLARAINAMTAQLEAAFAAREESEERLRRFVADASHELRTPLASIRGYAQLQQSGALTDPVESAKAVDRIESEAERMGLLVEELLLLARLDQGRPLEHDDVDLAQIVADSVADARVLDPSRPLELSTVDEPLVIVGDDARLRQVVANLLSNTRAHTPKGSQVRVGLSVDGGTATLVVADNGPGMDEETARRVFDRFYRAETARTRAAAGNGLGLAIVSSVATAHRGDVTVATSPGQGSTFTLTLPRDQS